MSIAKRSWSAHIRLTAKELYWLRQYASNLGISLSDLLRQSPHIAHANARARLNWHKEVRRAITKMELER